MTLLGKLFPWRWTVHGADAGHTKSENAQLTKLEDIRGNIEKIGTIPIPVQTFPRTDDFTWEEEKQQLSLFARNYFLNLEQDVVATLDRNAVAMKTKADRLLDLLADAGLSGAGGQEQEMMLRSAFELLLACSPRKVLKDIQLISIESGWEYVVSYNAVIDHLASKFPRVRSGIFASRLKYSDVVQISDEFMTTLRPASTILDDLQRRFDLLEALQSEIQADLNNPENARAWTAGIRGFREALKAGRGNDPITRTVKQILSEATASVAFLKNMVQMIAGDSDAQKQREVRVQVFMAAAEMLRQGWDEWQELSGSILKKHVKVMFALKRDFFSNQVLSICDLITYNGYALAGTTAEVRQLIEKR